MIVSCTQCENAIAIEDERIPPKGMRIRCGRCGEPLVVRGSGQPEPTGPLRPAPSEVTVPAPPSDPFPYEPTPLRSESREHSGRQHLPPAPPLLTPDDNLPPPPEGTGRSVFGAPGSWQERSREVEIPPQERTLRERTGTRSFPVARRFDLWRGPARIASWLAGPAVAALTAFLVWTGWAWIAGEEEGSLHLAPREVEARFFTDLHGRQAAFVTGQVRVAAPLEPGASIRLHGKLVDGSGAVRAEAEGWAGALPPPGEVAKLASKRAAWSAWVREAGRQAPTVEEGSAPFFLLFHQLPEDSGSLRARIAVQAVSAPPAAGWVREDSLE